MTTHNIQSFYGRPIYYPQYSSRSGQNHLNLAFLFLSLLVDSEWFLHLREHSCSVVECST